MMRVGDGGKGRRETTILAAAAAVIADIDDRTNLSKLVLLISVY